jgi:hypothetical protein
MVRTLTIASLTMIDLRAKLERRCSGEYGHTTIEHQHERCRTLKDHYGTTNADPAGHAMYTPTSLGAGGGCAALAPHLPRDDKGEEMEYQDAKRVLKAVYGHSDSDSSTDEHRKMLHEMYGGCWDITSRCIIKTLRRAVVVAAPAPKTTPHHKWMETSISFDTFDCPKNMVGARQHPLLVSSTITNIKLYHILVDGGVALNLISLAAFEKLQILMSRLAPSCPFIGVALVSIIPRASISLPVTFEMPVNYRTESVIFDVAEVNLPFNSTLGRPALYQFMVVAHYGYLVLKMASPNDVLKVCGDRSITVSALEKL